MINGNLEGMKILDLRVRRKVNDDLGHPCLLIEANTESKREQ